MSETGYSAKIAQDRVSKESKNFQEVSKQFLKDSSFFFFIFLII